MPIQHTVFFYRCKTEEKNEFAIIIAQIIDEVCSLEAPQLYSCLENGDLDFDIIHVL